MRAVTTMPSGAIAPSTLTVPAKTWGKVCPLVSGGVGWNSERQSIGRDGSGSVSVLIMTGGLVVGRGVAMACGVGTGVDVAVGTGTAVAIVVGSGVGAAVGSSVGIVVGGSEGC